MLDNEDFDFRLIKEFYTEKEFESLKRAYSLNFETQLEFFNSNIDIEKNQQIIIEIIATCDLDENQLDDIRRYIMLKDRK